MNNLHLNVNGKIPEMKVSNAVESPTRLTEYHEFSCHVYILDARIQDAGGPGPPKSGNHALDLKFTLDTQQVE